MIDDKDNNFFSPIKMNKFSMSISWSGDCFKLKFVIFVFIHNATFNVLCIIFCYCFSPKIENSLEKKIL